jgi:hypothetical protein
VVAVVVASLAASVAEADVVQHAAASSAPHRMEYHMGERRSRQSTARNWAVRRAEPATD